MRLHCIFVPARTPEPAQSELNALLTGSRVLAVHREWLADGAQSGWAFCVEVLGGESPLPDALKAGGERRRGADIDYRQVLSEEDFAVYARLRSARKHLAQRDGVPLYDVCSNEQMAAIVTGRVDSLEGLAGIDGMGAARVTRYGADLLAALSGGAAAAPGGPGVP